MSNAEHIEILRHDTAHIMAMAVQELFPETQVTIGPVIENGFFYDFARDNPFTDSDLEIIEKKIQDAYDIIKSKQLVDQESVSRHNVSIGKIQAWQEMLDIAETK